MPLFNDLKKIFFGAKSVAKHQAERAGDDLADLTKQAAREVAARAPEYIERGRNALQDLGDAVFREPDPQPTETAKEIIDEELSFGNLNLSREEEAPQSGRVSFEDDLIEDDPAPPREPSAFRQAADSGLDAAARAGLKAKGVAAKAGDELLDRAATIGADLKGKADRFVDHANREAERIRMEEALEKARAAGEHAEARARAFDNSEAERETDESILSGTDSFFDRADRFARGDYQNEGGKDVRIQDDPEYKPEKKGDLIGGWDDKDNDGDSLIDDAVIDEEDDEEGLNLPELKE